MEYCNLWPMKTYSSQLIFLPIYSIPVVSEYMYNDVVLNDFMHPSCLGCSEQADIKMIEGHAHIIYNWNLGRAAW